MLHAGLDHGSVSGCAHVLPQKADELLECPSSLCCTELDLHSLSFLLPPLVFSSPSHKLQYLQVTQGQMDDFLSAPALLSSHLPTTVGTLVLQQDLSNTPLAPAILQLCLCQVDLTCAQNWAGINRQSPGPHSRGRAKATIFPHSKFLQLELW